MEIETKMMTSAADEDSDEVKDVAGSAPERGRSAKMPAASAGVQHWGPSDD